MRLVDTSAWGEFLGRNGEAKVKESVAIRVGAPVVCRDAHFDAPQEVLGAQLQVEQV